MRVVEALAMKDRVILCAVITLHSTMVWANICSFFLIPFLEPWYVAAPIMSLILLLTFSRVLDCPLTTLENYYRKKLGMRRIGGFVGHYFIKPWRRLWARREKAA